MANIMVLLHRTLALALTSGLLTLHGDAVSQPQRPLRVIVAYGPGTSVDVAARAIGEKLAERMGRPVVIDNRPGANGMLALQAVAKSEPNGDTLLFTNHSPIVINPHLYAAAAEPLREVTPVGMVAVGSYLLVAHPSTGIATLDDLIRVARQKPGKLTYSSYGVGSGNHLCMEMIQQETKVRLTHIPYRTGSLTDLVGGQVDVSAESIAQAVPYAKEGKLNAIAFTDQRMPSVMAKIPAVREKLTGYRCENWVALFAPAAMRSSATVQQTSDHVRAIVAMPDIQKKILDLGLEPLGSTPGELEQSIRDDLRKWGAVIKAANIKVE
ncbi:Bug family tripartite tricarboxylate transporter substrate binding protein [Hydrogenophaga laconesensis]|uniref:Tripartite-type tricarboxylate transporter receptor subunit TctC n=1 Tax=Hydrogenophaga laconesensis TaxID=1805971 RepID=A0ABU1VAZ6_9BURK|nr:tripartite tricarboxylate transporter substrate binding protein [Hydrogenophaga laconesensis]MDR7094612.1 tripartite-type tricarboxylate transporter receptor subunit TctC [Hydrogenophaga laconesensis]